MIGGKLRKGRGKNRSLRTGRKSFVEIFDENFGLCRPVCSANGIGNSGVEERN